MSNKSISELNEYVGLIEGDEVLIISKQNEFEQYVSNRYKLATLADTISSDVYYQTSIDVSSLIWQTSANVSSLVQQTSSDLSTLMNATSSWIFSLSSDVSDAISIISNTSSFISSFLSSISLNVSNDLSVFKIETKTELCNFFDKAVMQIKYITGLSTLNYYTWIGDDISKLSVDPRYPELSSISSDVLWFDTSSDPRFHEAETIRRMDNLQVQIYRLGLQLKDVHKIMENGVIPGDAYNNTKDEMIVFADEVQPPDEILKEDEDLLQMSIYGDYYCKNKQLYYILFNPSGFVPKETNFQWIIDDHDEDSMTTKTISCELSNSVTDVKMYSLLVNLKEQILSSTSQIFLSASIGDISEDPSYVSDQISVDEVIRQLSAQDKNTMSFKVSSDFYDETFKEDIVSESFDISFITGTAARTSSEIEIQGNDYIDQSTLYYCVLDETDKKFPLNVNTNWYFLSSWYVKEPWYGIAALSSQSQMSVITDMNALSYSFINDNRQFLSVLVDNEVYNIASDESSFSFISSIDSQLCTVLKVSADSSIVMYKDGSGSMTLSVAKSDTYVRTFQPDPESTLRTGQVTFTALHYLGTPICQVSVELSNCTQTEAKDISAVLYVESNYDNSLSASKTILGLGGLQPLSSTMEPTVKAVCAKVDQKVNLVEKTATMHTGELVYFSDTDQLAVYNGSKFMSLNSSSSSGLTKEEIQDIGLDYLIFSPSLSSTILNKVMTTSDGKIHLLQKNKNAAASEYGYDSSAVGKVWVSHLLQIGKVYAGGAAMSYSDITKNGKTPQSLVSHNFVELVNASDNDINLDRIYLMYHTTDENFAPDHTQSGNSDWEFIKLEGVIKAHGTYLIRGAKCNPCKNLMVDVTECDLEWRKRKSTDVDILTDNYSKFTRSGDLIEFSQNSGSFFLIYATTNSDGSGAGNNVGSVADGTCIPRDMISDSKDLTKAGYIDLVGIGSCAYYENTPYSSATGTFNNIIVHKWFYMDPAKQGNKVLYEVQADESLKFRSNATLLDGLNLEKQQVINRGSTAKLKRDKYYYDDDYKVRFAPGTTFKNDGIFSDKTKFSKAKPNLVTVTFGIQATYDDTKTPAVLASRCFNWISLGYFDEYVQIRTKNADGTFGEWSDKYYSITAENTESWIAPFHQFYDRLRWEASDGSFATTHKVIVKNSLQAGTYQYVIGRDGDSNYQSDIGEFIVRKNSDVNSFSFIQTSDQQGFNWIEYQAWKASCTAISQHESDFDFTINTGDIAQSGNRVNEWIDYYDGRKSISTKEEMFTIGNNDLCGSPSHFLGDGNDNTSKFNLINVLYYFTFELDSSNQCYSTYEDSQYPIYSLYSFDYGKWHFISLVSEVRSYYAKAFPEIASQTSKYAAFAKQMNADVENWFKKDLQNYLNASGESDCAKCIVFMHEMPFTMVTPEFFNTSDPNWSTTGRSTATTGSKLNLENKNGDYRFSRLFRKAGIRLVIGGHKHTFTLSNPLYDAPEDSTQPDDDIPLSAEIESEDPFISEDVDAVLSHKPFIEMPMDGVLKFVNNKIESDIKTSTTLSVLTPEFVSLSAQMNTAIASRNETSFTEKVYELIDLADEHEITSFIAINDQATRLKDFLRIRFVNELSAPTYSMSQATGYKVVSNKELPSATTDETGTCRAIPWLLSYCAALDSTKSATAETFSSTKNPVQCRPTYIRYDLDESNISVQLKQVDGVYNITSKGKYAAYTLDTQNVVLSCDPVTFGSFGKSIGAASAGKYFIPTTSDDYMSIYSSYISGDTYIIRI